MDGNHTAKETTTFGLNSEKLLRLLKIGEDAVSAEVPEDKDRKRAELLYDLLMQPLPVRGAVKENLPANQSQLRKKIDVLSSEPIGKLLLDPETDIDTIRMVKDYASRLSKHAKSKAEHHVANTIYYVAIAHALTFCDKMITRYTNESLTKSFSKLSGEDWIPKDLCNLFAEAANICQQKA